jgi:hypothetical protein
MPSKNRPNYWRTFVFQKDLEIAVRALVDAAPDYVAFAAPMISDLIAERHYYCRRAGLRPKQFKKTCEDRPYRFYGDFDGIGWHPVSWTACVKRPPTRESTISDALRQSTEEAKRAFRNKHPLCQHCGKAQSVETHHANPTFADLVTEVFSAVSEADLESALKDWNFFDPKEFVLPRDHVVQRLFDERHAHTRLEALCKTCHDRTKQRKPVQAIAHE